MPTRFTIGDIEASSTDLSQIQGHWSHVAAHQVDDTTVLVASYIRNQQKYVLSRLSSGSLTHERVFSQTDNPPAGTAYYPTVNEGQLGVCVISPTRAVVSVPYMGSIGAFFLNPRYMWTDTFLIDTSDLSIVDSVVQHDITSGGSGSSSFTPQMYFCGYTAGDNRASFVQYAFSNPDHYLYHYRVDATGDTLTTPTVLTSTTGTSSNIYWMLNPSSGYNVFSQIPIRQKYTASSITAYLYADKPTDEFSKLVFDDATMTLGAPFTTMAGYDADADDYRALSTIDRGYSIAQHYGGTNDWLDTADFSVTLTPGQSYGGYTFTADADYVFDEVPASTDWDSVTGSYRKATMPFIAPWMNSVWSDFTYFPAIAAWGGSSPSFIGQWDAFAMVPESQGRLYGLKLHQRDDYLGTRGSAMALNYTPTLITPRIQRYWIN